MAKLFLGNTQKKKIYLGNTQIKKVYRGNILVFSSAHAVTYHIDTGNTVTKEVDDGADCIANAPSVSVSGYTFHGWREDSTASSTVLSSKTCDQDNIHLYAVLKQTVTVTLRGGDSDVTNSGYKYYNNGNSANASITLGSSSKTNYSLVGYRTDTTVSSSVSYTAGQTYAFASDTVLYAVFSQTITLTYNGNGATGGSVASQIGTKYYNNGNVSNPGFTLRANGYTRTGYTFRYWSVHAPSMGVIKNPGDTISLSASTTAYAVWKK